MENQNHTLTVQPRLIAKILFAAAVVISIFTLIGKYLTLFPNSFRVSNPTEAYILDNYFILEFRLNTESNVVIYFTAFILLFAAATLFFMIALYKNSVKDEFKTGWFALAAFFLFLSVYTASPLPEKHVEFYSSWTTRVGWFEFRWAVAIAGLIILAFLLRRFLMHFEPKFRALLFAPIILYYAGTLGVELFGARYTSFFKHQNFGLAVVSFMAELMAFGGLILVIYALLRYMEVYLPDIRFLMQPKARLNNKEYIQALQPRRFIQVFVIAAFVFGVLSFIGQIFRLFPDFYSVNTPLEESFLSIFIYQFGVNTEANMATHFNTLILVIVAALFLVIALLKNAVKDKYRLGWFVLSLFVLYMSIDEQCVLHEKLSKVFSGWSNLNGWLEYKWLIPALAGMIVFAALFIPFFLHLETKFKILFIVSAMMYFSGAFGGEMFSGRYASVYGVKNIIYSLMTTFEELLELNGINLLIYSLLHYIEIYFGDVRVMVGAKKS